jgi:hypothetical protein
MRRDYDAGQLQSCWGNRAPAGFKAEIGVEKGSGKVRTVLASRFRTKARVLHCDLTKNRRQIMGFSTLRPIRVAPACRISLL